MKQLVVACIFLFSNIFVTFSRESTPENEVNPQDTLKVYYLDEKSANCRFRDITAAA